MATRVLNTIKENGKLLGFRIATTNKQHKGIHILTLQNAEQFYKTVEKFDNAELQGKTWKGTECSLDKLPVQDSKGMFTYREGKFIVLYRLIEKDKTWGFVLMDLNGLVQEVEEKVCISLGIQGELINATVSRSSSGEPYISGIRKKIQNKEKRQSQVASSNDLPAVTRPQNTGMVKGSISKMDEKLKRMQELVPLLAKAAESYYTSGNEIMSNYEYDKLYDELEALEKDTGILLANSVTQKVGYTLQSKLTKISHPTKMLSLDKTKDVSDLANSLGGQQGFLGWKLDGLSVVVTYENGELVSAVTRGTGTVGEDITENYKVFANVPLKISTQERIVLRGEALISYKVFEYINSKITNEESKYKNPRNLCSGSVRQLDTKITKERKVHFVVFTVVEGFDLESNYTAKLEKAKALGFEVVDYLKVSKDTVASAVAHFEKLIPNNPYPTDGLVITIDDIEYGELLGSTNKFPRNAKAFKWKDEIKETELLYVDWSNSRTGAINPVAVFKPVDLEGTTVERASVHNVSIVEDLQLGVGDILQVYKANMIIPQVAENLTRSNTLDIPKECPVCNGKTKIEMANQAKVLFCTNEDCPSKHIGGLVHFATRDAMNIDGLSEATIERFVNEGYIKEFADIYNLEQYKDNIIQLEGFGKRSYDKIWKAVEKSREVELPAFLYALGVGQLGRTTSRLICGALDHDLERIINAVPKDLEGIDGVGPKTIKEILDFFGNPDNARQVREVAKELKFKEPPKVDNNSSIAGKTFVVTGDVINYKNRKELQAEIESLGGKVSGSVSAKTHFLINNDITSGSGKNKKAKELGVPIISEADYMKLIGR